MSDKPASPCALALPAPSDPSGRLLLFALRRMAKHGVRDAFAASALFNALGMRHRMPLVLLRALVMELARASRRTITVAPCCAPRMTRDEGELLAALAAAGRDRCRAASHLRKLTAAQEIGAPLSLAVALADIMAWTGGPPPTERITHFG